MEKEIDLPDDDSEDWEMYRFEKDMSETISPFIKKFLVDYCGERFYHLEAEDYREIDEIIKYAIEGEAFMISNYLYKHRTITDEDQFNKALEKFKRPDTPIQWPRPQYWFDRIYTNDDGDDVDDEDDDDDDDEFLEEELTEDQKKAKEVIASVDNLMNHHIGFSNFTRQGCAVLFEAVYAFLWNVASFDVMIVSTEGLDQVQSCIYGMGDDMFDKLYGYVAKMYKQ